MGLDQYAFIRKNENQPYHEDDEIAYWRKHNALQGWMENLWKDKGNLGTFNRVDIVLTKKDLDRLEQDLNSDSLPQTDGFFYGGDSRFDEHQKTKSLQFIVNARQAMEKGLEVVYCSCW